MIEKFTIKEILSFVLNDINFLIYGVYFLSAITLIAAAVFIIYTNKYYKYVNEKLDRLLKDNAVMYKAITRISGDFPE